MVAFTRENRRERISKVSGVKSWPFAHHHQLSPLLNLPKRQSRQRERARQTVKRDSHIRSRETEREEIDLSKKQQGRKERMTVV